MTDGPGRDRRGWGAAIVQRAKDTGDATPAWTMALVMALVSLATFVQVAAILAGSISTVIMMIALALLLSVLPSLFDPVHGRWAALCRLAGLVVAVATTVALGMHVWG